MGAFLLLMFSLTAIIGLLSVILQTIGSAQEKKGAWDKFQELLNRGNIESYEYQKTVDGSIIVDDRGKDNLYVVYNGGWYGNSYRNITNVELSIDDSVAYQSSISSAVGRAVVGGVLAGGIGAIIGGVTGGKKGQKKVHRIALTISYDDPNHPYERVLFLDEKEGIDIYSDTYKQAEERSLYWSKLISSLMNR